MIRAQTARDRDPLRNAFHADDGRRTHQLRAERSAEPLLR
jgi:hypothetical protein